jgi:tripartite-type tricarboxylate transporter receptor subunit TctC
MEETMKCVLAWLFAALALFGACDRSAHAQDYPNRPIKLFIAFPVGGLLDTVSRIVGDKMSGILGQQIVIEARPGAGGTLATAAVARAEPDG